MKSFNIDQNKKFNFLKDKIIELLGLKKLNYEAKLELRNKRNELVKILDLLNIQQQKEAHCLIYFADTLYAEGYEALDELVMNSENIATKIRINKMIKKIKEVFRWLMGKR